MSKPTDKSVEVIPLQSLPRFGGKKGVPLKVTAQDARDLLRNRWAEVPAAEVAAPKVAPVKKAAK